MYNVEKQGGMNGLTLMICNFTEATKTTASVKW